MAGDLNIALSQVGPSRCMVQTPMRLAPQRAQIVLQVDDKEYRRDVYLTDGILPDSQEVPIRDLNPGEN